MLGNTEMELWIDSVADPGVLERWTAAFRSVDGMAQSHNAKHFLRALREDLPKEGAGALRARIDAQLEALP